MNKIIKSKVNCNKILIDVFPKIPNYKVYKHNDLIQCKSDFSAMEHRIIVLALAQITKYDENLKMYRINIQDVLGKKLHRSNYNLVRNAVRKLHKSTIEMEDGKKWKSYSFITKAQGEYGTHFIEIQFHEDIQHFLLNLKTQYTSYTLDNVMKFKRNYSLRIYELCKQYSKIGTRTIKMDYLRTLFCLEDKYHLFSDFRKFVLNPALEEINNFSDIEIKFIEKREAKKVDSIYFIINRNRKVLGERESKSLVELALENDNTSKFLSLGFNDNELDLLRKKYKEERLSSILELFEKNINEIKFPKPWIEKALEENYVDNTNYKKHIAIPEEKRENLKIKLNEIGNQEREIRDIQEKIYTMQKDIEFYQITGELRSGDIMRFPADYTTEEAIEELQNRVHSQKNVLFECENQLSTLKVAFDHLT